MTNTIGLRSDGRVELIDVPAREAPEKYKKFITESFSRALPDLVFYNYLALRGNKEAVDRLDDPVFKGKKTQPIRNQNEKRT